MDLNALGLQQRLLFRMTSQGECTPLARPSAHKSKRWTDVAVSFQRTSRWIEGGCVIAQAGMRSERDAVQEQGHLQQRERSQAATALQQQLVKSQVRTGVQTVLLSPTAKMLTWSQLKPQHREIRMVTEYLISAWSHVLTLYPEDS